jgi:hypothetical protein
LQIEFGRFAFKSEEILKDGWACILWEEFNAIAIQNKIAKYCLCENWTNTKQFIIWDGFVCRITCLQ